MSTSVCDKILEKVHDLEMSLLCNECNNIFKDPVIIGRCGHMFCRLCASNYIGKQCPTCQIPIDSKDTLDDKQLQDLLPLVEKLKLILQGKLENDNQSSVEIPTSLIISDTPISARVKSTEKLGRSVTKSRRTKKSVACNNSDVDPHLRFTPKSSSKDVTPNNSSIRRKRITSSPNVKKLKHSPFRYSAFSAAKRALRSPLAKSSPVSGSGKVPTKSSPLLTGNLEKKNLKGETLLHVAVIKGDEEKVAALLEKNAKPNVTDNAGWTPLHEASQKGFLSIAKLLVKHGASVNVLGPDNITPLHDALLNGHFEVAKFLVSVKADLHARTAENVTALDLCRNKEWKLALLNLSSEPKTLEVAEKNKSPSEKTKMIILYTSLDEPQVKALQKCANEILHASVVDGFTLSVTHVITILDNNQKCKRTIKILQGILSGKWIVSYQWVEACLKQKKLVSEEPYEAKGTIQLSITNGPSRARLNDLRYPLFHGCYFFLYGNFSSPSPPKETIGQLIQLGGGKLLAREPKLEVIGMEKFLTPHHTEGGPLSDFNHFILYHEKPPPRQVHTKPIAIVNFQWLVNSICAFKLLNPSDY